VRRRTLRRARPFLLRPGAASRSFQKTNHMANQSRLAAIVNTLTDSDLAGLLPHAAIDMLKALRHGPPDAETTAAIKRLALLLLRDDPADDTPPAARLRN
jgi:hypothetical protein